MERQDQEDGQPAQPLKVRSERLAARPLGALHASPPLRQCRPAAACPLRELILRQPL